MRNKPMITIFPRGYLYVGRLKSWVNQAGLWPRMSVAISVGFAVLFLVFFLLAEWVLRDSIERILEERLVIAEITASQIDGVLDEAIAEVIQAEQFLPPAVVVKPQASLLASETDAPGKREIPVNQPVGILIHPPVFYVSTVRIYSNLEIMASVRSRTPFISKPFIEPELNRPVVAIIMSVVRSGYLVGRIVGLVDLHSQAIMDPLLKAAKLGQTGHASLVNEDGLALATTYDLPFLSPGEHAEFYRQAMAARKPVIEVVPFEFDWEGEERGEMHVMAFAPLENTSWGIAVGGDYDETFAGVQRMRSGLAILGASSLLSVWLLTMLGTRRLLQPVKEMTLAAQSIADGKLNTPLQITQNGEIGSLASALEEMRRQLLGNIEKLSTWNQTLENRVAEKTAHLQHQQMITKRLFQHVITAQEEERGRIARELHDEIGGMLTAIELNLDRFEMDVDTGNVNGRVRISQIRELAEHAMVNLRRVITAMRPGVLDELGLIPALGWIIDRTLRPLGIQASLDVEGFEHRLPGEIETTLFRIAQEAINNTARHSQASNFSLRLVEAEDEIQMVLKDDGKGWDDSRLNQQSEHGLKLGLAGMQERAALLGGRVSFDSLGGRGLIIRVTIPHQRDSQ